MAHLVALRRVARIVGQKGWALSKNKVVLNGTVDVLNCPSIRPTYKVIFPQSHTLLLRNCHPDFLYNWLTPETFKCPREIWLASQIPCESIFTRFPDAKFYLLDNAYRQWCCSLPKNSCKLQRVAPSAFVQEVNEITRLLKIQ